MVAKILALTNDRERYIFWALVGLIFLCAGFYMYLVKATVHNLVAHQNLENEASSLTLSIGKKEFSYIEMRNAVDLPLAYSLGFKDVSQKIFVSKKSVSLVSMNQAIPDDSL